MIRRILLSSALAVSLPALSATYPPGSQEAVVATAGKWSLYHEPTQAIIRANATYPVADGGEVPGMVPGYVWLLQIRTEPPTWDSVLYEMPAQCPEAIDVPTHERRITCTPTLRPAEQLCAAGHNRAQERIAEAIDASGLSDPADQYRAIALLTARVAGQTLNTSQSDWLQRTGQIGIDYVDQVREVEAGICAWVVAHPGQAPDLGDAVWPALPGSAP